MCSFIVAFFLPAFSPHSLLSSGKKSCWRVPSFNYSILFFMGAGDREITCQLLGLAHKVEM